MRHRTFRMVRWMAAAAALLLGLAPAEANSGLVQTAMDSQRAETVSVAPLMAPDLGAAWGRAQVRDRLRDGELTRQVEVWAMGLEPGAAYEVRIDGIYIAEVTTDAAGFFSVELGSPDDSQPPVPGDLPPAELVERAEVLDASLAVVLEGSFHSVGEHGDGATVYVERIPLDDQTGGFAHGMASVKLDEEGEQKFETRGGFLEPGRQYRIVVDGFEAGLVTADATGFAELALQYPAGDDGAALPPELIPVDELRVVEWRTTDGTVILAGTFTGISQQDGSGGEGDGTGQESISGHITGFTGDGFIMENGMGVWTVIVTSSTVFDGVSGLDALEVGVHVEVEGTLDGSTITAVRVELELEGGGSGGGGDGMGYESISGHITGFTGDGFIMENGMGVWTVIVTPSTVFDGVSGLDALEVGVHVEVEGTLDGSTITAVRVELELEGGGSGGEGDGTGQESISGHITGFTGDGFTMQNGLGMWTVIVTPSTVFEDVSGLDALEVGVHVEVEGTLDGSTITAVRVELEPDCGGSGGWMGH